MRVSTAGLLCLLVCVAVAAPVAARAQAADSISGTWAGDWGPSASDRNPVMVELKWDGKALTGQVNPGENAIELKNCTFDAATGAVHMEADATSRRGNEVHYSIDGKVEGDSMTGTWNHDARKGDFKITKK